ncbi:MAG: DNA-directed RNA polymerase subunit M [Ignisphaera sp.]|nr:DNA-directed RNA polymerase subunit M [Ignisphaera sp.]MCX8168076.1 DNA-directed RNA polymerase subunit M [Ignisphaera sp.]MDW8085900.1 NADH pyrophosphatase zinc ribbon domain-containing protein [Ignisphaera sp.]
MDTQFCPKCGGLLLPTKKEEGTIALKCSKCGYEASTQQSTYKIETTTSTSSRVHTTSVISNGKTIARKKEEIEQEKEEYYKELFLELLHEEEYGGEET